MRQRLDFLFLNLGHFYDHFFVLIFATAAALALTTEWGIGYAALIPYATPGFVAFGVCTLPAGWIADKWSREGMMAVFFLGIGASAIATGLADSPLAIAAGLTAIGAFAAIYHPVGLALVIEGRARTGTALAVNGVFGNLGVASAALVTGVLIDVASWRWAFVAPGIVAIATGFAYWAFVAGTRRARAARPKDGGAAPGAAPRDVVVRVFAIILVSTAIGGLIFQSATFALPKVLDERLPELAGSASRIGWYAFLVFAAASLAQLVVGVLIDRHSARTVFAAVTAMQAVLFWTMQHLDGTAALLVSAGFMLAVFGQIPINDVLVGRIARGPWRSRIFAVRYVVTFAVSATAVPLIAWLHANGGFARLFAVLAVAAAAIFAVVLLLPGGSAVVRGAKAPEPKPAE